MKINCFDKIKNKSLFGLKEEFDKRVPEDTDLPESEQYIIGKSIALAHYDKLIDQYNVLRSKIDTKLPPIPSRPELTKAIKEVQDLFSGLINKEIENGPDLFTPQPESSTETVVSRAEVAINKGQIAKTEEEVDDALQKVEAAINEVQSKIGKLTENWSTEGIEHELPNRVIGKTAKKEITKYAKEIARINGWEIPKVTNAIYDNIAPIGGEVVFHLDIPGTHYRMYVQAKYERDDDYNYAFNGFFYRLEEPTAKDKYKGANQWQHQNITAKEMAEILKTEANKYIKPSISEIAKESKGQIIIGRVSDLTKSRSALLPTTGDQEKAVKALTGKKIFIGEYTGVVTFASVADGKFELHDEKGQIKNVKFSNGQLVDENNVPVQTKEEKRIVRDENIKKEIDDAADEFFKGGNLMTSGGIDPVKIEKGVKLIGLYMKAGVYKFSDIVEDMHERWGDKVKEFFEELSGVYGYYYNTKATEEEANKMDPNLRGLTFESVLNTAKTKEADIPAPAPALIDKPEIVDVPLNGNKQLNEELGGESQEQPIPAPAEEKPIVTELQHNSNFVIPSDFVNSKSFNVAQKLQDNIDAIRVLISLKNEKRRATYDEQKTLFKYVGWGGIKEIGYNPKSNMSWKASNISLRAKIQEAHDAIRELDEENFKANLDAVTRSTQNAHYTAIPIIRGMWNILRGAGFKGGTISEPSAGVGHFVGTMPRDIADNSKITAVEIENITGQILKGLYPNISSKIAGYQDVQVAPGTVDLVISNIPFGKVSVTDINFEKGKDPALKASQKFVHKYFFARAMQDVKPNGTIAFVTTTGILDSPINQDVRDMIADKTEFLGAIRLPNDAFRGNANTQVTTDIIFLRKFAEGEEKKQEHDFTGIRNAQLKHKNKDQTYNVAYNGYFHDNPDMVLGDIAAFSMYGDSENSDDITVLPKGINLEEGISKLGDKIFKNNIIEAQQKEKDKELQEDIQQFVQNEGQRPGNIVEISPGEYGIYSDELAEDPVLDARARAFGIDPDKIRNYELLPDELDWLKQQTGLTEKDFQIKKVEPVKIAKKYQEAIKDLLPLRKALNDLYAAEYGDMGTDFIEGKRADLNKVYKKFVKNNGSLLSNKSLVDIDIDGYNLLALENVVEKKVVSLADIFTKRVFEKAKRAESAQDIHEAIAINLNEKGSLNLDRLAELLKKTPDEIIEIGKGLVYKNPITGDFETKDKYLSGNVRKKLNEARIAATTDKFYDDNVVALETAQPTDLNASQIYAPISAPWIAIKYLNQFASHIFKQNIAITKLSTGRVSASGNQSNTEVEDVYGTNRMNGFDVLAEALQNRMPIIKDTFKGPPQTTVVNEKATKEANDKVNKIRQDFDNWIWQDDERRNDLVNFYNNNFNNTVQRRYDGSKLTFPGYAGIHKPAEHQKDVAWMIIQQMGGIMDHIVGAGKTLAMALAAFKLKQMGLIKKPIMVGLKANAQELANEYKAAFPMGKVLFPKEKDFTPQNRRAFFAKMANNNWDLIVMTHDQFGKIEQSQETQQEIINQEIEALENDIRAAKDNNLSKRDLNGLEIRKQNLEDRLHKLTLMSKDKSLKSFEEMGIDYMFVDESHQFKNLAYNTIQRGIAGLGKPDGSARSFNMLFAIRTLQKMYGGDKGVVFASGTTINNSMVEMFSLFKYLRPNRLGEMGINSFDQWANTFARVSSEIEFGVTNALRPKVRMREFMNVPELSSMYREIADVRNDSNLKLDKPVPKQTFRVKTATEIVAGEPVTIEGNKFKVIGRIKGIEKNEYWVSLMSVGKDDWMVPNIGDLVHNGKKINYSEGERSDGLLINIAPTLEQRKYSKKLQRFAETKDGSYVGIRVDEKSPIMLLASTMAAKMAIDMKLINPSYESTENGKLGVAADYITEHYKDANALKGIQLVFSDLGTPKDASTRANLFNLLESKGVDRELLENIFGAGAYSQKQTFPTLEKIRDKIFSELEYTEAEFEEAVNEANDQTYNIYEDLKNKLIRRGIPSEEIVFIHDYKSDAARQQLFIDAKAGKVRVIIGSTSKLGTGVNVQVKVVALHNLDVKWDPGSMDQRGGRGLRQGNLIIKQHYNNKLPIYYYATEATLDAYKYQLLGSKQKFINQVKTGEGGAREISEGEGDEENGVSFAAFTAMLSGNPILLEKAKVDSKVKSLDASKKSFEQEKYSLKDKIAWYNRDIDKSKGIITGLEADKKLFESNSEKDEKTGEWKYKITLDGEEFTERKKAGDKLLEMRKAYIRDYVTRYPETTKLKKKDAYLLKENPQVIGNIAGFDVVVRMRGEEGDKGLILAPEFGVKSPNGLTYDYSGSMDAVSLAGHLQREIRSHQPEIDRQKNRMRVYDKEVKDKENYLKTLPDIFPKQKELEDAVVNQMRLAALLDEMSKQKALPSVEELESLGEQEKFPNEFELENLYAINSDGQVLRIAKDEDLSNALGLKTHGSFANMVSLAKQDGFRFFIYKEEGKPETEDGEKDDNPDMEPEFSVTGPTSDEIQEMQDVVKEQIDLGNNRLADIQSLVATELEDDSPEMRQLVEQAYHEYGKGEDTPAEVVKGVIGRIESNLSAINGNGVEILPNTQALKDKADQLGNVEYSFYSPLEKSIGEIKVDKLPAKQWAEKFKGEEAKWTGLTDWLNSETGSLSKADIQNFLKDNRIEVSEVVKQSGTPRSGKSIAERKEEIKTEFMSAGYDISQDMSGEVMIETKDDEELVEDPESELTPELYARAQEYYELTEMSEEDDDGDTKYPGYQLPGEKSNYKEVLITMPVLNTGLKKKAEAKRDELFAKWKEQGWDMEAARKNDPVGVTELNKANDQLSEAKPGAFGGKPAFQSNHFNEPNILAHVRMNTRIDAEGKKVLFLEEIQSDWGEIGRKKGFNTVGTGNRLKELFAKRSDLRERMGDDKKLREEFDKVNEEIEKIEHRTNQISAAPFVTDTNSWTKLALKVALKQAVKEGADKIAWTTGEQQADRYDLSQHVERITVSKPSEDGLSRGYYHRLNIVAIDGKRTQLAVDKNGKVIEGPSSLYNKPLSDVVGKEMAEKIMSVKQGGLKEFSGLDFKIGGEGMTGFYGNPAKNKLGIVGNVAKGLFKQEPKPTVLIQDIVSLTPIQQHSVDITPEMKAQVENVGQPLFQFSPEGKVLGFTHEGKVYLNGKHLNPNTPIHEAGHIWVNWAENNATAIYDRGIELVSGSAYLDKVKGNHFYQMQAQKLDADKREKFYQHEALAMAIGDKGAQFVTEARKDSIATWLKSLWNAIKNALGFENITSAELQNLTFDEFSNRAVVDILKERQQEEDQDEEEQDQQEWEDRDPIADYAMTTTGEVKDMLSGKNITESLGYAPEGDQSYSTQRLAEMLQDGKNMIGAAMGKWGTDLTDYGQPLFNYIKGMSGDEELLAKKAVLMATFLGEIREEINRNPNRADELRGLDNAVTKYYQDYMNKRGKEVSAGALLRLYRDKYMGDIFANQILEESEIKDQNAMRRFQAEQVDIESRVQAGIEEFKKVTQQEKDAAEAEAAEKKSQNVKAKQNKKAMSPVEAQKTAAAKAEEIAKKGGMTSIVDKIKNFIEKCK